jgi:hypothetical protein
MRRRAWLFVAPLLAAGWLGAPWALAQSESERPRIYKWIDENGIAHYTTDRSRIPSGLRLRSEAPGERSGREGVAPRPARDEFDSWAQRDRQPSGTVSGDVWDDGSEGLPGAASSESRFAEEPRGDASATGFTAERNDLDARIAELEAVIAEDEEAIKSLISDVGGGGALDRGDDPEFRSIAARLPKYLAELRALRERRARLESP